MKKLIVLVLTVLLAFTLAGCKKKQEIINYDGVIDIPSVLEVDIEDLPERLEKLIEIEDESKVIKVTIDTDEVNFSEPGDYSILIIVDYIDGTTRVYNSILRLALNEDIGVPRIIGVRNHLVDVGSDELDLMDGVAFTDDNGVIDSGIYGEVNYNIEGLYNVTYYVEDTAGNYVTSSAFVLVGKVNDYYDELLPTLYEASATEKRFIREYSLLYSAVFRKAEENSFDSLFFDYLDHFFSDKNYEELIGRKLRDDEILAINQYRNVVRKEDKIIYEEYTNAPISNEADNHFENAYLALSRYTATITRKDYLELFDDIDEINDDFVQKDLLRDVNDFDIIVNTTDEIANEIVDSLNFYRDYRAIEFDDYLLDVLKYTDYQMDQRIHSINFENISELVRLFNREQETPWTITGFKNANLETLNQDEILYLDILSSYSKYKLVYLLDAYDLNTETKDTILTVLDTLCEGTESEEYPHSLLNQQLLDVDEIEMLIGRTLSQNEKEGIELFFDLYLTHFRPLHLTSFMLLNEYFTSSERELYFEYLRLKQETESYSTAYQPFEFDDLDIYEMEHILGRSITEYEIDALEFGIQYKNLDKQNLDVLYRYRFTRAQLDLIAKYSLSDRLNVLYTSIRYSTYNNAITFLDGFENKTELLNMYNALRKIDYLALFDTYYPEVKHEIDKDKVYSLVNLFLTKDYSRFILIDFLKTNNYDYLEEEYQIDIPSGDREIMDNFIAAKQRILDDNFDAREYIHNNFLYYECDLACIDSFETMNDYLQIGRDEFHKVISNYEIDQIEEGFMGNLTAKQYDAFTTIYDFVHDANNMYRVLEFLFIYEDTVNEDNFNYYRLIYDFMMEDSLSLYNFGRSNIVQVLSNHRSLTQEEIIAAEYIEEHITTTINQQVFSQYYDHAVNLNMDIDIVRYVNVYQLYQRSNDRMSQFFAVIDIPDDINISFEDETDFGYVKEQFEIISNTSDNLLLSSSKYNTLTLEELSSGLEVLSEYGIDNVYLTDEEYTALYLDEDFTTFLNGLSTNNNHYVTEIIKIVIQEQYYDELSERHPELFYQASDVDDIMTNLFYDLAISNTSYFWDIFDLEINLGRDLTESEKFIFEFVDFTEATELKIKEARNLGLLTDEQIPLLDLKEVFEELSNQDIAYLYSNISDYSPKVYVLRQFLNHNFTNEDINNIGVLLNEDANEIGSLLSSIQSTEDLNQYSNEEIVQLVTRVNNLLPITNNNGSYFLTAGLGQYSFGFEYNLLRDNHDFINAVKAALIYKELENYYPYNEYTTPKELIINAVYYVLDKPGEIVSYSVQDFETIKPPSYFINVFGRELTDFEQYIINEHSRFVATNFIQTSITNYNENSYEPLTLRQIEELYALRDLYILVESQGVSIYIYASDLNLQYSFGILLSPEEIELINLLEEVNTN